MWKAADGEGPVQVLALELWAVSWEVTAMWYRCQGRGFLPSAVFEALSGAGTPGSSLVVLVRCAPASGLRSGPPAGC